VLQISGFIIIAAMTLSLSDIAVITVNPVLELFPRPTIMCKCTAHENKPALQHQQQLRQPCSGGIGSSTGGRFSGRQQHGQVIHCHF